jgi:type III restriction enzyme
VALHPAFPASPYEVLDPSHRWFPADEALRESAYEKLLPPLVAQVRAEVKAWRDAGYAGASSTSTALLRWWFEVDHLIEQGDGTRTAFRYYFAQREAVETVVWLHDVRGARDKFDLMRFDASGAVSAGMFDEDWPRYVIKMATGAGKTKVLSLLIAWCYFHKLYEPGSALARNFLLIAPNIIVLDRLRADFDGLRIFFNDPVLPDNGHAGRNWRDDFQITLHLQDDVRVVRDDLNRRIVERPKMVAALRSHKAILNVSAGQRVQFEPPGRGVQEGVIVRYNQKTVTLVTSRGKQWRVAPALLRPAGNIIDMPPGGHIAP